MCLSDEFRVAVVGAGSPLRGHPPVRSDADGCNLESSATARNELRYLRSAETMSLPNLAELTPVRFLRCSVPIARLTGHLSLLVAGHRDASCCEVGTRHKRWFFSPRGCLFDGAGRASQSHA